MYCEPAGFGLRIIGFGMLNRGNMMLRLGFVVAMVASVGSVSAQNIDALYRQALLNDTQVIAARANARATNTLVTEGLSRLLPNLSLQGQAEVEYGRSDSGFPGLAQEGLTEWSANSALVLNQNLYNRQAWAGYESVQLLARQSQTEVQAAEINLKRRVVDAFLEVLKAEQNAQLSARVIATVTRQLEQTQERFEVGLVAITDVLEATATLDQAIADQVQADNALILAQQELARITGTQPQPLPALSNTFDPTEVALDDLQTWINRSRQNPALVAQRQGIDAAREERRASAGDLFPVLAAQARYGYGTSFINDRPGTPGNPTPDDFSDRGTLTLALTATVQLPLYDGGRRQAGLDRAGYRIESRMAQLDGQTQQTELAIRQLYQQLQADLSRLQALTQVVSSRTAAAQAIELGYEVGSRNVVEVLNAQQALLQAQTNLSNARHDFLKRYIQLREVAGVLSSADLVWLTQQFNRES